MYCDVKENRGCVYWIDAGCKNCCIDQYWVNLEEGLHKTGFNVNMYDVTLDNIKINYVCKE